MNENKLQNKIAVVSGAFGYVGLEVVKRLAQDGFSVAMLYKTTGDEKVQEIIFQLHGSGNRAYKCDLENSDEVNKVFDLIESEVGEIYACVCASGKSPTRKKIYLTTVEELKEQIEQNFITSFNFLSTSAKKLKEKGSGIIIGVTTIGVIEKEATSILGAYIPAKFAVQGMLTMLKEEMSKYGVRVYSVAPGFMAGGMNRDIPKAFVQMIEEKSPTHKLASATDIAEVISKICSSEKEYSDDLTIPIAPEYGLL